MKERFQNLIELLSFRNMWDDQEEEDWEDYDRKEEYVSGDEYADDTGKNQAWKHYLPILGDVFQKVQKIGFFFFR